VTYPCSALRALRSMLCTPRQTNSLDQLTPAGGFWFLFMDSHIRFNGTARVDATPLP